MYILVADVVPNGADRQEQAIGRIVRLLPLLSFRELDALADRLRQKVNNDEAKANLEPPSGCAKMTVEDPFI